MTYWQCRSADIGAMMLNEIGVSLVLEALIFGFYGRGWSEVMGFNPLPLKTKCAYWG
jgi:hypothetical protein